MKSVTNPLVRILHDADAPSRFGRLTVFVIGLALVARLAVLVLLWPSWDWRTGVPPDQWNELTINLVDHHTLGYFSAPDDPSVYRGPIFPLVQAPLYLLFGRNYAAWSISLLLLDTLSCLLIIVTSRKLWGNRPALLAGLFYALNLPIIYYTAKVSQVTSAIPLVVLWLYLFTLWEGDFFAKRLPWVLGLVSGVMILNKTVFLPVPFICVAVLYWVKRAAIRKVGHFLPFVFYLATTVAVIAPWTYRNYLVTNGKIVPVQSMFWEAFVQDVLNYDLDASMGSDRPDGEFLKYALPKQDEILVAHGVSPNPPVGGRAQWDVQREKAFHDACILWIKENPSKILRIKVANIWNFWVRAENWRKTRLFILMQVVYLGAATVGFILLVRFRQLGRIKYGLVLIPVLWGEYCLVLALSRYSLDLVPVLGLLFGLGLDAWIKKRPVDGVTA